jgi:hypothetical protein
MLDQIRRHQRLCELLVQYEQESEIIGMMSFVRERTDPPRDGDLMELARQDRTAAEMALHSAISSESGTEQANAIQHSGLRFP